MRRSKPSYANESGTDAPRPSLQARLRRCMLALSLLLGAAATAPALAAPITGENQPGPSGESADAPDLPAPKVPAAQSPTDAAFGGDTDATVIEFSVLPSADDPTKMETVVILQRGGGRRVCVNLKSTDVIVRSYRKRGDEPFSPAIPGEIRGLTSGDSGDLIGFNETKVFIRPHTTDDEFTNPDECFFAVGAEGCFLPDEADCDQRLEEGDVACVVETISRAGCSLLDHANLLRQLRILITLNQPPGEAPIITAADIAAAPEIVAAPQAPAPAGPAPASPTGEAPPSGAGGGAPPSDTGGGPALVDVPNVVGLSLLNAERVITSGGLVVGTVTIVGDVGDQFGSLEFGIIGSARAQVPSTLPPPVLAALIVIAQSTLLPNGATIDGPCFTCVPLGTAVDVVAEPPEAVIPEPSTLTLFGMGLGLLILITCWRRRSA